MSGARAQSPQLMPILSPGRHRNARHGACFMEMASFLAGERWTDQPRCTHPLLARLARLVNDATSDRSRQRLAVLIPEVVGLNSTDLRVDARIALRSAAVALEVVVGEPRKALAVAVRTADGLLADLEGRPADSLEEMSRRALDSSPEAAAWSLDFVRDAGISPKGFRRIAAPHTVLLSVQSIVAAVPDCDDLLRGLLSDAIADVKVLTAPALQPTVHATAAGT